MSEFVIEFTQNAAAEFDETIDWYAERSVEAADRWIEEFEKLWTREAELGVRQ